MKKLHYIAISALLLTACGSNEKQAGQNDSAKTNTATTNTTDNHPKEDGELVFTINGQQAKRNEKDGKHSVQFGGKGKTLHLYLQGYIAPDTHSKQLDILIKDFEEKPGTYTAYASYMRRDENKTDFSYNSQAFSITISAYTLTRTKENNASGMSSFNFHHAEIDGTFSGQLDAQVFDPAKKSSPFAQPLKIEGHFSKLPVASNPNW